MKKNQKICWEELNRAIQKNFTKGNDVSNEVKLRFFKISYPQENDLISLVIDGIDNKYTSSIDGTEETVEKWEIYLKDDGTWEIS